MKYLKSINELFGFGKKDKSIKGDNLNKKKEVELTEEEISRGESITKKIEDNADKIVITQYPNYGGDFGGRAMKLLSFKIGDFEISALHNNTGIYLNRKLIKLTGDQCKRIQNLALEIKKKEDSEKEAKQKEEDDRVIGDFLNQ